MRRGLAFSSFFLLLVGLEMSTEGLSLIVARLRSGVVAVMNDVPLHVSPARFVFGATLMVVGMTLWVLLIWSAGHRGDVATVGSTCPQCGNVTRRVKRRAWERLLSWIMGQRLTHRHCDTCGWSGLSSGN